MRKRETKRLMAYLGMPLAFAVIGYLLLYMIATPVIKPLADVLDMALQNQAMSFGDSSHETIFDNTKSQPDTAGETVKASGITFPKFGTLYGNIRIEGTSVDAPLFFGDSNTELKKGAGQFNGSMFPGCGTTVLIGGHNHTYFNGLKDVKVGQAVTVRTNYGTYTYEVTETAVKKAKDASAYDLTADEENLVLYTCYPFDMLGLTPNRYFVYAKYVSGPKVLLNE